MKAVLLKGVKDLVVEDVPDPKPQGDEVVVKVDESSNTKMTFMKKAIQQVIREGDIPSMDRR